MDMAASVGASAAIVTPRRMTKMYFDGDKNYYFSKSIISIALEDTGADFGSIFHIISALLRVKI